MFRDNTRIYVLLIYILPDMVQMLFSVTCIGNFSKKIMVIYCLIFSTMSRWFCVYIWTRELLQVGVRPPGLAVSSRSVYIPASWEPPGGDQQPTRTGCPQWWEFSVRYLGLFGHTTDQIYIFLPDDWCFCELAYVFLLFPAMYDRCGMPSRRCLLLEHLISLLLRVHTFSWLGHFTNFVFVPWTFTEFVLFWIIFQDEYIFILKYNNT